MVKALRHSDLGLTSLRNQLTIRPSEPSISPQDPRLLLAQKWLEASPGAPDIFALWDNATLKQTPLLVLLVSVSASVLTLLSSHYSYHAHAIPILKTLLTPAYTRRMNGYLGGSHTDLILVTLKLYNSMSSFAGGRERKTVLESFPWGTKVRFPC